MNSSSRIINGLKIAMVFISAVFILTSTFTFMRIVLISNPNKEQNVPGLFYSYNVDDNYQIYIALPSNYNPSDSKRYPVIYLLDGDWYFDGSHWRIGKGGVKGIISRYAETEEMPEAILVAIGYPSKNYRERDYLYPTDLRFSFSSGGGMKFYSFIKDELIPKVDAEYKTNITYGRTIIGHSHGGYFSLFSLITSELNNTSLFKNFLLVSPTVFYYNEYLLNQELTLFEKTNGTLAINIRISVGGDELSILVQSYERLKARLLDRNYTGMNFDYELYENKHHRSVVEPSFNDGLQWLFSL
ncbi:MAG: alpha/beta hydrolase [Candidatus Heimdallarchaeota archaeon]|nr:alpha/beta hydrolase [Candidatus Heimdallarchaeota archaeon]MBY8994372.1 alpha/beta hydrolase [Candidatus Heimdallarchaeota archaeon]